MPLSTAARRCACPALSSVALYTYYHIRLGPARGSQDGSKMRQSPLSPGAGTVLLAKGVANDPPMNRGLILQVLIERGNLPGAAKALKEAAKMLGPGGGVRDTQVKVQQLQIEERQVGLITVLPTARHSHS